MPNKCPHYQHELHEIKAIGDVAAIATTSLVFDLGKRKVAFGLAARHLSSRCEMTDPCNYSAHEAPFPVFDGGCCDMAMQKAKQRDDSSALYDAQIERLLDLSARFPEQPIAVNFRTLVGLNPGVDRYTHLIHPYPAKLIFNIPNFFINNSIFSNEGDTVLDPFCGSGTVMLESILSGRRAVGADANPFARLLSSVKTNGVAKDNLLEHLELIQQTLPKIGGGLPNGPLKMSYWFHDHVLRDIDRLHTNISKIGDSRVRDFFRICLSFCARKASLCDPRLSVPVRMRADKDYGSEAINRAVRGRLSYIESIDVVSLFNFICRRNIKRVGRLHGVIGSGSHVAICDDARHINTRCVDLVVTSPPYAGAQKYVRASSISLQILGFAECGLRPIERLSIGREHYDKHEYADLPNLPACIGRSFFEAVRERNPLRAHIAANYLVEMDQALAAAAGRLRQGGYMILVVGNNVVCGEEFDTRSYLRDIVCGHGLSLVAELHDDIRSRGLMTKRNKTAALIGRESILIMKK